MPKRKKFPKLPNGFGSIKKLSGKRTNPFAVYPPATLKVAPGQYKQPQAICYTDDWYKGFAVLTAYHAGTYYPGYERTLNKLENAAADRLLADYNQAFRTAQQKAKPTFKQVYEGFYKYKYGSVKKYSEASMRSTQAAFKNCAAMHDKVFDELKHSDLQGVLDNCKKSYASLELIVSLFHQMYAYAEIYELCEKDYSKHIRINKDDDDESGIPFSDSEMKILWENKDNEVVELLLILCYSGFRIGEVKDLEINLEEKYFCGGIKTNAGKKRIVPIHPGIELLVQNRINQNNSLLNYSVAFFRKKMYKTLSSIGIERHTPHDCRHTFSKICDDYKVDEREKKRMLGHAFSDITNKVYGHTDLKRLREEIEKIQICF